MAAILSKGIWVKNTVIYPMKYELSIVVFCFVVVMYKSLVDFMWYIH